MSAASMNLLLINRDRKNAYKPVSAAIGKYGLPIDMFADGSVDQTLSSAERGFDNEALFCKSRSIEE